jgi:hypothetical protein
VAGAGRLPRLRQSVRFEPALDLMRAGRSIREFTPDPVLREAIAAIVKPA